MDWINPRDWRLLFGVLIVASVFCYDAPQEHPVAVLFIGLSFAGLALKWLDRPTIRKDTISLGFVLLFISLAVSLPVALSYQTTFYDWALRGFAPLAFLAVFFLLPIKSDEDVNFIIATFLVASAVWCALVLIDVIAQYQYAAFLRWTVLSSQLIIPFNIVGITLIVFGTRVFSDKLLYPLLFVLTALTISGGYRSHLIVLTAVIIGKAVYSLCTGEGLRRVAISGAVAISATIPFIVLNIARGEMTMTMPLTLTPSQAAENRVPTELPSLSQPQSGDTGRILEFKYATEQFLDSPMFGKGLAYRVPSNLIFNGQEEYLRGLENMHGKKYPFLFYVHSSIGYVMMSNGIFGLFALGIIGFGFATSLKKHRLGDFSDRLGILVASAGLAAFSLVSAVYLLPQFTLMLGSFAAVLAAKRPAAARPAA